MDEMQEKSTTNWFRQPPKQRQKWGDTQILPHVNWGDLFFDLFYVAGAYNLAYIIKSDPSFIGLLYFLGCFGPLINCFWKNKLAYDARFQLPDDIMHVVLEVLQLCLLASAVLHIRPAAYMSQGSRPEMFVFCLSCLLGAFSYTILYLEIRFWGADGQKCAAHAAVTSIIEVFLPSVFIFTATVYSGIAYYNSDDHEGYRVLYDSDNSDKADHVPIILLFTAWIIRLTVLYPVNHFRTKGKQFREYSVPYNISFLIHRHGEWLMLMLGESVLSLLIVDITDSFEFYLTFFLGILSVVFLQYLYFKSQPHDADGHVMRRSRPAAVVYAALLQFYSAALIVVGVSYKMLLTEYSYEESVDKDAGSDYASNNLLTRLLASGSDGSPKYSMEERRQRISIFFCVGLAIIFLCLDLMTFAHIGFEGLKKSCYCPNHGHFLASRIFFTVVLRFAVVIATGTACLYVTEPDSVALIGFASILVQIFFRIIRKMLSSRKTSDLNHDEEIEGHWPNTTQPMSIPSDDKFKNEEK